MKNGSNSSNDKRLQHLEKLLAGLSDNPGMRPINPDALAILAEAESMIGGPDDNGPVRGREFTELAVARALEKRGRSTREIATEWDQWMSYFGVNEGIGGGVNT